MRWYNPRRSFAIRGNQRQSVGLRGERRKRRASDGSRGHQWPSEALRGHQRPSEAIRGHQWPSVAIRGNQWGDLITIEKHGRVQRAGGVASRLSHILGASVWPAQRWRETSMTVSTRARPTLGWSSEGSRACVDLCRSETRTLVVPHSATPRGEMSYHETLPARGELAIGSVHKFGVVSTYDNPGCV